MDAQKKKNVIQAIISAIISILTALAASSCTLACIGCVPFRGLLGI